MRNSTSTVTGGCCRSKPVRPRRMWKTAFAMIESANVAMRQAAENLQVTHDRYEERMCPLSDMLDAQTQWQKASADVIEARAQYRIYLTNYLKATGKL